MLKSEKGESMDLQLVKGANEETIPLISSQQNLLSEVM